MGYPLDDYVLAVKRRDTSLRSEASNAIEQDGSSRKPSRACPGRPPPAAGRRPGSPSTATTTRSTTSGSTPEAYTILSALRDGRTLAQACAIAVETSDDPRGRMDR